LHWLLETGIRSWQRATRTVASGCFGSIGKAQKSPPERPHLVKVSARKSEVVDPRDIFCSPPATGTPSQTTLRLQVVHHQ
jgi:hypothetical protein